MTRIIILVLFAGLVAACGKSGDTPAPNVPGHVIDPVPHNYTVGVFNGGQFPVSATIKTVCNFGRAGTDSRTQFASAAPPTIDQYVTGGCTGVAYNITADITNTGSYALYFEVKIDDVWHPELELVVSPGQTINFQRGF